MKRLVPTSTFVALGILLAAAGITSFSPDRQHNNGLSDVTALQRVRTDNWSFQLSYLTGSVEVTLFIYLSIPLVGNQTV